MELGERPKSADTESRDSTLLSASSIGSPTAFSTAIKPPPGLSLHPSADSPLTSHGYLQNHHDLRLGLQDTTIIGIERSVYGCVTLPYAHTHTHTHMQC